MKPVIKISFRDGQTEYAPGDFLICEYEVQIQDPENLVVAIETSTIWITDGKGESDIGVHFFERRQKQSLHASTLNSVQRLSTVLPASPLSYAGKIVKISWCVRVRLFMADGTEVTKDQPFRLGDSVPYQQLASEIDSSDDSEEDEGDSETTLPGNNGTKTEPE